MGLVNERLSRPQLRWRGRFGNRMFQQYAYGATYARLTGLEYWLPSGMGRDETLQTTASSGVVSDTFAWRCGCPTKEPQAISRGSEAVQKVLPDAELVDVEVAR